jgi:hypothetical protein
VALNRRSHLFSTMSSLHDVLVHDKMDFLRVRASSHVIENMNEFLNFLKKVDQCSTFEEKINQFGVVEKKLCYPNCFFYLWAFWAASKKHQK